MNDKKPVLPMRRAEIIERKLRDRLAPQRLKVVDDSHKHKGHAGWREGGETHYRIEVVSDAFLGRSRVDRQRQVYEILSEELTAGLHALQLKTLTPEEDEASD